MTKEESVVREVLELYASKDPDAMLALFADDGVYDNVPESKPLRGKPAIHQWLEMVFKHCWVEVEVLHMATSGEWVLNERLDTHVLGERRIVLPVMNATRVVNGKVVEWRDYYCRKMVAELGLTA